MLKSLLISLIFSIVLSSNTSFATPNVWRGEYYNITPKHNGISVDYCRAHVLNTYQASPNMIDKEVLAENGLKAKDLGYVINEKGGIFSRKGTALLSGMKDGRPWAEKVYYVGYAVEKNGMEQGSWYTKDCKGFYKIGPM